MKYGWILFLSVLIFSSCSHQTEDQLQSLAEVEIQRIELAGEITHKKSEISGLAWYKDYLILVPQYPDRFGNHFYAVPKQQILDYLSGTDQTKIIPIKIPLETHGLEKQIKGYEGFEAIVFKGDSMYLTIESEADDALQAFVVSGKIAPDLYRMEIFPAPMPVVPSRSGAANMSEETLILIDDHLATVHEANGGQINPAPQCTLFDLSLNPAGQWTFPRVEYRLTDATAVDGDGKFWVINYMYPGDVKDLKPGPDSLKIRFGYGATHAQAKRVERLLEFQYRNGSVKLSGTPPLYLQLDLEDDARNWEGIVRLEDRGFLIATDRFPETILAFVPYHK